MKIVEIFRIVLEILAVLEAVALITSARIIKNQGNQLVKEVRYSSKLEHKITKLENEVKHG